MRRSASPRRGALRAASLLSIVAACGPKPAEGCDSDTDGCAATDDGDPVATTGEVCDPLPPPLACPSPAEVDPLTAACSLRGQADCDGPLDEGGRECRWVETKVIAAQATCADAEPSGACVALYYQGDGCESVTTCGVDTPGETFFRVTESCAVEVFQAFWCGYILLGWETCAWDEPASATCGPPWPSQGPGACSCAC